MGWESAEPLNLKHNKIGLSQTDEDGNSMLLTKLQTKLSLRTNINKEIVMCPYQQ